MADPLTGMPGHSPKGQVAKPDYERFERDLSLGNTWHWEILERNGYLNGKIHVWTGNCPLPCSITRKCGQIARHRSDHCARILQLTPCWPLRSLLLPPAVSYLNATEPKLPSLPTVVGSNIPITAFRQAARQLRGTTFFSLAPQVEGPSIRLWRWDELGKRVIDYDQDVAQIITWHVCLRVCSCVLVCFVQLAQNTDARKREFPGRGLHRRGWKSECQLLGTFCACSLPAAAAELLLDLEGSAGWHRDAHRSAVGKLLLCLKHFFACWCFMAFQVISR